jgi:hypothetical protein
MKKIFIITGTNKELIVDCLHEIEKEITNKIILEFPEHQVFHEKELIGYEQNIIHCFKKNQDNIIVITNSYTLLKEFNTSIIAYHCEDQLDITEYNFDYMIDDNFIEAYSCCETIEKLESNDCGIEYAHIDNVIDYQDRMQDKLYYGGLS